MEGICVRKRGGGEGEGRKENGNREKILEMKGARVREGEVKRPGKRKDEEGEKNY